MQEEMQEPIEVLRQGLCGQRRVDDDVVSSAVILADRLGRLKSIGVMFEAVSFSPDIESMLAAHAAAVVN